MKKYLAVLLAATLLLAGCAGDSKADAPSPNTTGSPPTTSPSAPTTTTSPTTTAPKVDSKVDPNIPAAARAHTPEGAEAFVRYFYSQLNVALATPKSGLVSALSGTTCKTCTAFEGIAVDLASKRQRYQGDGFAVSYVGSIGESELLVVGEQPTGAVIDINGAVVKRRTQAEPIKFIVTVPWSSEGWRVGEIRVMK